LGIFYFIECCGRNNDFGDELWEFEQSLSDYVAFWQIVLTFPIYLKLR